MPTTPIYALRYPAPSDPADGPLGFQNLATDVETVLRAPAGSTLPASPADGQVARVKVSANGPVWAFVYLATSTAPKWHFLGGGDLVGSAADEVHQAAGAWGAPATGPKLTVPLAGDYDLIIQADLTNASAGALNYASYQLTPAGPTVNGATVVSTTNTFYFQATWQRRLTGLAAGGKVDCVTGCNSGNVQLGERTYTIRPVRVG